jgi:hypothetical protein
VLRAGFAEGFSVFDGEGLGDEVAAGIEEVDDLGQQRAVEIVEAGDEIELAEFRWLVQVGFHPTDRFASDKVTPRELTSEIQGIF